jgi:hypothetical protein
MACAAARRVWAGGRHRGAESTVETAVVSGGVTGASRPPRTAAWSRTALGALGQALAGIRRRQREAQRGRHPVLREGCVGLDVLDRAALVDDGLN